MNEERKMILQMLKDGEISVDEAERLIDAVSDKRPVADAVNYDESFTGLSPKRILIQVTEHGKTKVNVKIPFSLMRAALKLGKTAGLIGVISTKYMHSDMEAEILEAVKSIDPDEILSSLSEGAMSLPCAIVDVDDDVSDQQVKIILE